MIRTAVVAFVLALGTWCATNAVVAQSTPPDLVRMRDGGFIRGVIIESVPGDHVTILLPTGEMRQIPAADIDSIGIAAGEPQAAPELRPVVPGSTVPPTVGTGTLRLDAHAGRQGMMLHGGLLGMARQPLCAGHCTLMLDAGEYQFIVTDAASRTYELRQPVRIDRPGELRFDDRGSRNVRLALGFLAVASAVTSVVMFVNPGGRGCVDSESSYGSYCTRSPVAIGVGATLLAGSIGFTYGAARMPRRGRVLVLPR